MGGHFLCLALCPPLLDDADATHSNAARHILTSGDWVTLYVNGIRYLEKAPLPYWLVAASFKVFGFKYVCCAPATVDCRCCCWRCLAICGEQRPSTRVLALYSGVAILTSVGVFLFTRVFIPEVWLSLFLAMALYTLLQSLSASHAVTLSGTKYSRLSPSVSTQRPESHFALAPYFMWTSLALAVLTKGLVALVFFIGNCCRPISRLQVSTASGADSSLSPESYFSLP